MQLEVPCVIIRVVCFRFHRTNATTGKYNCEKPFLKKIHHQHGIRQMESRPRKTSRTLYGWLWTEILHMQPLQGVSVDYTQQIIGCVASPYLCSLLRRC